MAKNPVLKRLAGSGNFTVPAGVNAVKVYAIPLTPSNVFSVDNAVLGIGAGGVYYGWGRGDSGQIGDGTTNSLSSPVQIATFNDIGEWKACAQKAAGNAAALTKDGVCYTTGFNSNGYLGDGTTVAKSSPVQVLGSHVFEKLDHLGGGVNHLAIKADGSLWTWGNNGNGQLGDGTSINKSSPVQVIGGHVFEEARDGDRNAIALKADGTIWGWGRDSGNLNTGGDVSSPVQIQVGTLAEQLATGEGTQFALQSDGSILAWGASNSNGKLGDGTTVAKSTPVAVVGPTVFTQVAAGHSHTAALDENGNAWCWGFNSSGQLGDDTTVAKSSPVQVIGGHTFVEVLCGTFSTHARKADGTIWGWGENGDFRLGDGTNVDKSSPVQALGSVNFTDITAARLVNLFTPSPGDVIAYDTASGTFGGFPAPEGAQEFLVEFFG